MKLKGKIYPLKDKVLVCNMNFGEEVTKAGIILRSDDGKVDGIRPRWGQVIFVGPEELRLSRGDWILVEHGRWSRGIRYENEEGEEFDIRLVDNEAIMLMSDTDPNLKETVKLGEFEFEIVDATA